MYFYEKNNFVMFHELRIFKGSRHEDGTYEEKFTVIKSFRRERNGRGT